jgi:hypothetical protein
MRTCRIAGCACLAAVSVLLLGFMTSTILEKDGIDRGRNNYNVALRVIENNGEVGFQIMILERKEQGTEWHIAGHFASPAGDSLKLELLTRPVPALVIPYVRQVFPRPVPDGMNDIQLFAFSLSTGMIENSTLSCWQQARNASSQSGADLINMRLKDVYQLAKK